MLERSPLGKILLLLLFAISFPKKIEANSAVKALTALSESQQLLAWAFGKQTLGAYGSGFAKPFQSWLHGDFSPRALRALDPSEMDQFVSRLLDATAAHRVFAELGIETPSRVLEGLFEHRPVQFSAEGPTFSYFQPFSPLHRLRRQGRSNLRHFKYDGRRVSQPVGGETFELVQNSMRGGSIHYNFHPHEGGGGFFNLGLRVGESTHTFEGGLSGGIIQFSEGEIRVIGSRLVVGRDGKAVYEATYLPDGTEGIRVFLPDASGGPVGHRHATPGVYRPQKELILQVPENHEIVAFDVAPLHQPGNLRIVAIVKQNGWHFLRGWLHIEGRTDLWGSLSISEMPYLRGNTVFGLQFSPKTSSLRSPVVTLDLATREGILVQRLLFNESFSSLGRASF